MIAFKLNANMLYLLYLSALDYFKIIIVLIIHVKDEIIFHFLFSNFYHSIFE